MVKLLWWLTTNPPVTGLDSIRIMYHPLKNKLLLISVQIVIRMQSFIHCSQIQYLTISLALSILEMLKQFLFLKCATDQNPETQMNRTQIQHKDRKSMSPYIHSISSILSIRIPTRPNLHQPFHKHFAEKQVEIKNPERNTFMCVTMQFQSLNDVCNKQQ